MVKRAWPSIPSSFRGRRTWHGCVWVCAPALLPPSAADADNYDDGQLGKADHARGDAPHCHFRQGLTVGGHYRLRLADLCELAHTPGCDKVAPHSAHRNGALNCPRADLAMEGCSCLLCPSILAIRALRQRLATDRDDDAMVGLVFCTHCTSTTTWGQALSR
jgi:hypothetical protein